MSSLTTKLVDSLISYDGTQLSPHWIYRNHNLMGDALISFLGPADVTIDHMVDLEDVRQKAPIYSPAMVHFLGEWFIDSLDQGILLQHLLCCEIYEELLERGIQKLKRRGNDMYYDGRKLSVSIATRSSVSVLIHAAVNINTEGTPIPTSGLAEMNIEPYGFAQQILGKFSANAAIWRKARVKVSPR